MLLGLNNGRSAYSIHQEPVKLARSVGLVWVERLVAGYFSKFAGISKWRQASIVEARDGIEDQVQAIVKESMEEAFKQIIPEVPFVVEHKIVDSLG